jgi:sugar phosphate isomerase/epimerase
MNNPLYAMDTCFQHAHGRYGPAARAEMLKELGYAGTCQSMIDARAWDELPEVLRELDRHGLRLFSTWINLDVSEPKETPRLPELVRLLHGRQALVEVALHSRSEHDAPSAPRADARAIEAIRSVLAATQGSDVRVTLYPHVNFWLERVEDAVRLGMRLNRPELGMTFNLFHWLATDGQDLDARLQLVLPRLLAVTICGATLRGPRDATIEPLDRGSFDGFYFLASLARVGYTGPIGLQGWSVGGDVYANLKRSIAAYRDMTGRVARHPSWGKLDPPWGR